MLPLVSPNPSNMKTIVLACLVAIAVAAPQLQEREVVLLRDDRITNEDGTFSYALEADNGINTAVEGAVGSAGQINQAGSYTYGCAIYFFQLSEITNG
ncbi:cuticle protein AM/CP1114-like [Penaeus monodon]|uniref:cuticle protein AM/CP1114-like n=1 Tax=Penaeus monodon TaxID=6687 RepID=UPI0018A79290|nr:cuticle protein AM/CP1114-like [Penaeus monodon]